MIIRPVVQWLRHNYSTPLSQKNVAQCYKDTFESKPAAEVLEDLRRYCMVYGTTHVAGDSHATALNEGKRQVYLHLVNMLEVKPGDIPNNKRKVTDDRDDERPPLDEDN